MDDLIRPEKESPRQDPDTTIPLIRLPYISKWRSHILLYEPKLALKIYILLATTVRALPMLLLSQQAPLFIANPSRPNYGKYFYKVRSILLIFSTIHY